MDVNQSIFRAYDIRGIYPGEINEDTAYAIGKAYAALLEGEHPGEKLTVAVGRDMRLSSPAMQERLIEGLLESGINVDNLGLVSTPTFYFGVAFFGYAGGLQVSASHNPKEWNGVKMTRAKGFSLSKESGIAEIASIIREERFISGVARGEEHVREGVVQALVEEFLRIISASRIRPLTIVTDTANAMGGLDVAALFEQLPCRLISMNSELDGTFPSHEADPQKPENVKDLKARVLAERADLGIATDGDGDRIFFVDERGEGVPSEILRAILAKLELEAFPGRAVVSDVNPARIVEDVVAAGGGKFALSKVGHSYIKEAMYRENAIFGGEHSGHYFYPLPCGIFETPMLLTLKLLALMSEKEVPMSEVAKPFRLYATSGEINVRVADRDAVARSIEKIKTEYADGDQSFLDGVRVVYPDYWFTVRSSNTEPLMRINLEAQDEATMRRETERLRGLLTN